MNRHRLLASVLILTLLAGLIGLAVPASAADVIRHTVNIAEATKNEEGPGYIWANRTDVLTLSGLNIDTDDAFGLRLPQDATVILKGKNHIKAAKYGVSFSGTLVIKGSGSLTIEAGEIGLYLISQETTQKIRLLDGTYTITAGTYGVYSDAADFSFIGDSMDVTVSEENGAAIEGRVVNLLGGSFSANAPVRASHMLTVDGAALDIEANAPALEGKTMTVKNIALSDGGEYAGEYEIHAKSAASGSRPSVLFGDSVPGFVDVLLLIAALLGVAAGIVFPTLRRKKKAKELYARLEQEGYISAADRKK